MSASASLLEDPGWDSNLNVSSRFHGTAWGSVDVMGTGFSPFTLSLFPPFVGVLKQVRNLSI